LRRLQLRLFHALMRTVNLLREVRRRPTGPDPSPTPARDAAASRGGPDNCGKLRNEPKADARPSARPESVRLSSLTQSDLLMTLDCQNRWIQAYTPGPALNVSDAWVGRPPVVAPTGFESPKSLGGGSCRRSDPIGSARSPAGAGSYNGSDPCQAGEPDRLSTVRPDFRLESPTDTNGPAPAGRFATTLDAIRHCEEVRNEPNANAGGTHRHRLPEFGCRPWRGCGGWPPLRPEPRMGGP
jgi:hypothetical protein